MSTLQVDRIEPYQSASVTIVGLDVDTTALNNFTASQEAINTNLQLATASLESSVLNLNGFTASQEVINTNLNSFTSSQETLNSGFATTGSNTFQDKQTVNSYVEQNFGAPGTNQENAFANITGAQVNGNNYNRVYFGIADYPSFGDNYADYFAIEYYDSLSYNFGSEFNVNGKQTNIQTLASGSGQTSYVRTTDNYDGTSQVSIGSGNKVAIAGRAELSNVMQLAAQDPLPSGNVGELAVSGSNLYFYTDQWREVAFV